MQSWLEPATMQTEYIKSRQGNLRCFPCCTEGSHRSRSFCGDSIKVRVEGQHAQCECVMVGEIRRTDNTASLQLNDVVDVEELKSNSAYFVANYVHSTIQETRFSFNPNRRWKFSVPGKIKDDNLFCFTMFLIVDGVVQHVVETTAFKIIPIWRLDKEEAEEADAQSTVGSPPIQAAVASAAPPPPHAVSNPSPPLPPFTPSLDYLRATPPPLQQQQHTIHHPFPPYQPNSGFVPPSMFVPKPEFFHQLMSRSGGPPPMFPNPAYFQNPMAVPPPQQFQYPPFPTFGAMQMPSQHMLQHIPHLTRVRTASNEGNSSDNAEEPIKRSKSSEDNK